MMDSGEEQGESRGEKRKKSEPEQENGKKSKPETSNKNGSDIISNNWRPWADFPQELLYLISNNLSIFLRIGRVCRSWRLFFSETKRKFITSRSPLIFEIPLFSVPIKNLDEKPSRFYEITSPITYKTRLPAFYAYNCLGFSSGYLILKRESFSLINPITGHQIQISPILSPPDIVNYNIYDAMPVNCAIFASVGSRQDHLMVALSPRRKEIYIYRDNKWKHYFYSEKPWFIRDMIVFDGGIFFITDRSDIGIFNLKTCEFILLKLKDAPQLNARVRLVASNAHLLIVYLIPPSYFQVYRIDFSRNEWDKAENLGDEALFIDTKSGRLSNTTKWGGRSNCLYYLSYSNKCRVYSLNGEVLEVITLEKEKTSSQKLLWYFPHQIWSNIDHVRDDYFGDI